ncbi:MAG: hypothetical protein JJ975_02750 [Bacteroidia bacterium]|nr:hypothetical protein [Bacteroidia bacterium]
MFKVILEISTGEFTIVKSTFNTPPGFVDVFVGSRPACKAWIKGVGYGRTANAT